jgi:hypothetical protein
MNSWLHGDGEATNNGTWKMLGITLPSFATSITMCAFKVWGKFTMRLTFGSQIRMFSNYSYPNPFSHTYRIAKSIEASRCDGKHEQQWRFVFTS